MDIFSILHTGHGRKQTCTKSYIISALISQSINEKLDKHMTKHLHIENIKWAGNHIQDAIERIEVSQQKWNCACLCNFVWAEARAGK